MPNADSMAYIRLMWPSESHPEISALVVSSDNNNASSLKTSWNIRCSRSWILERDMAHIGLNERVINCPPPEHVVFPHVAALRPPAGEPEFAEQIAHQHVFGTRDVPASNGGDPPRERRFAEM